MVKFGFFLLLGNGVNLFAQLVPSLVATLVIPFDIVTNRPMGTLTIAAEEMIYAAYTLLNLALIPTPILIPTYFKPIRKRLYHWLCCCMQKKSMGEHKSNVNTVERNISSRGEDAQTEV